MLRTRGKLGEGLFGLLIVMLLVIGFTIAFHGVGLQDAFLSFLLLVILPFIVIGANGWIVVLGTMIVVSGVMAVIYIRSPYLRFAFAAIFFLWFLLGLWGSSSFF
jgi:hypothetical protein